jgi:D-3-phosphoglycerate dehydrogenase / 2-oxoglutarate reductase
MPTPKTVFWFNDGKSPNVADSLDKNKEITLHRLKFDGPQADNWGAMSAAHAYCICSTRQEVPEQYQAKAPLLARCPDLLAVSASGAGYDTVDVPACTAAGVLVVNQSGGNADAVAEHVVGMMLSLTKNMPQTDHSLRVGSGVKREQFKGWNAKGRTVGIVGLGEVGSRVARICGLGLQMRVIAYDPYLTAEQCQSRGAEKVEFATLLKEARFVTMHCPYDKDTRNMIDAQALAAMQPGAIVINAARGGIVNEADIAAALKSGHLSGAGIDTWVDEPPPPDHPLLALKNVIATNHTAGITHDSRINMAEWNAAQVAQILRGERPPRLINPDAWDGFCKRYERVFGARPQ